MGAPRSKQYVHRMYYPHKSRSRKIVEVARKNSVKPSGTQDSRTVVHELELRVESADIGSRFWRRPPQSINRPRARSSSPELNEHLSFASRSATAALAAMCSGACGFARYNRAFGSAHQATRDVQPEQVCLPASLQAHVCWNQPAPSGSSCIGELLQSPLVSIL
jgi:hypothetical protein